jgi:hypothetical protein
MSAAAAVRGRLGLLAREMRAGLAALERIAAEVAEWQPALEVRPVSRPVLALMAVDLHDYYTAVASICERVARTLDGTLPDGPEWHRELLDQMAGPLPPVRAALIGPDQAAWLHGLRSFRHFFRHAYAVDLDPARLAAHAGALTSGHAELVAALRRSLAEVEAATAALGRCPAGQSPER